MSLNRLMRTHSTFKIIDKLNSPLDTIREEAWNSAKRRLELEGSIGEAFTVCLTGVKRKKSVKEYTVEIKVAVE